MLGPAASERWSLSPAGMREPGSQTPGLFPFSPAGRRGRESVNRYPRKGVAVGRFSVGSAFSFRGRVFQGLSGWEGKPLHPPLTDVPIGAYVIAPILDLIAFTGRDRPWGPEWFKAAGYTFLVGAAFSLLTALTGFADWLRMRAGSEVRRIANSHALIMVVMTLLVLGNLAIRFLGEVETTTAGLLALSAVILVLVTIGGTIGGSLVYDKGYKVRARMRPAEPDQQTLERKAG